MPERRQTKKIFKINFSKIILKKYLGGENE
jgi:hypothetical protein